MNKSELKMIIAGLMKLIRDRKVVLSMEDRKVLESGADALTKKEKAK